VTSQKDSVKILSVVKQGLFDTQGYFDPLQNNFMFMLCEESVTYNCLPNKNILLNAEKRKLQNSRLFFAVISGIYHYKFWPFRQLN